MALNASRILHCAQALNLEGRPLEAISVVHSFFFFNGRIKQALRWTCGHKEELMYWATRGHDNEKNAGGSGVTVQLRFRQEPKWKPGCGLFYACSWEATYCISKELCTVNIQHVCVHPSTCEHVLDVLQVHLSKMTQITQLEQSLLHTRCLLVNVLEALQRNDGNIASSWLSLDHLRSSLCCVSAYV